MQWVLISINSLVGWLFGELTIWLITLGWWVGLGWLWVDWLID